MANGGEPGLFDPAPEMELDNVKEAERASDKAVSEKVLKMYRSMGFDRYEVISAWIKEMRRGSTEDAVYWARIMLEAGDLGRGNAEVNYMVKRLQIFATEDLCPMEDWAVSYAAGMSKCAHETHAVLWFTYRLTLAKKWWETEHGLNIRTMTVVLKSEIHSWCRNQVFDWTAGRWRPVKEGEQQKKRPVPPYAVDIHTWRGKRLVERKEACDERWSGNGVGIAERLAQARKNGFDAKKWKGQFTCSWGADDDARWYANEAKEGRDGKRPARMTAGKAEKPKDEEKPKAEEKK